MKKDDRVTSISSCAVTRLVLSKEFFRKLQKILAIFVLDSFSLYSLLLPDAKAGLWLLQGRGGDERRY